MRTNRFIVQSVIFLAALAAAPAWGQFITGSVVVLREGDGVNPINASSTPVYLDQYNAVTANQVTPTFSENVTAGLAASGVNFMMTGNAVSEGQLTRSVDGHQLLVEGYNVQPGASGGLSSLTAALAPRGYVTVDVNGNISPFVGSPDQYGTFGIRSVAANGANVYAAASGQGILLFQSDNFVDTAQANNRVIHVINGNLYFTTASGTTGLWGFTGTPTSTATATVVIGVGSNGTSPYGFAISPDGNTAYIADDGGSTSGNATGFGVQRWQLANGTWTLAYSIPTDPANGAGGARGLAVDWTGANPVVYATSAPPGVVQNKLVRIVDTGANSTVTVLAISGGNQHFAGVDLAPTVATPATPVFGLQPVSVTVVTTLTANFTVSALGYPAATLQWQISSNNGNTWGNLTDGNGIVGSSTATLSVTPANTTLNGSEFRCLAINTVGTATSSAATLTVTTAQAAVFAAQPLNQAVSSGQSATFSVLANGNPAPTLQWQQALAGNVTFTNLSNGGSFSGVTTATLTITGTIISMSGNQYRCVATNVAGPTTSNAANLTVNQSTSPPFVPGDLVVLRKGVGGTVALTSSGSAIYLDEFSSNTTNQTAPLFSSNVTGTMASSGNLVMSGTATAEGQMSLSADGHFLCVPVFNNIVPNGSVASANSTACPRGYVLVDANGNYSALSTSPTAFSGTDIRTAFSAGTEVYESGAAQGIFLFQSATFVETQIANTRVVRIENGNICFSTASTGVVGIWQFQGIPTANATVTQVIPITVANASPYGFSFSPNGTIAYVADDAGNGNTSLAANAGIQHWVLGNGTWTNDYIIHIVSPTSPVGARGLVVDWTGANPIIYATTSNANSGSGANQLVKIVDNAGANSTVIVLGTAATNTAFCGVDFAPVVNASSSAPVITTQPGNQTTVAGQSAVFQLGASGAPAPTLQWQISSDGGITWSNLTDNATFAGSATPILTVNTTFAMAVTQLTLRAVATNFGGSTPSNATILTITAPPNAAPAFTTQPQNQLASTEDDVALTAVASGFPVPAYQWSFGNTTLVDGTQPDGSTISGSATANLTIGNIQLGEAGNYTVVASNSQGNTTSNVATVTVDIFPDVENTNNQSVFVGQSAMFTANVTGQPTPTLQWQRIPAGSATPVNLTEGGTYTGTTTAVLTVSNTTAAMSGDQFQLEATNAVGSTVGLPSGMLTVNVPVAPNITIQPGNQSVTAGQAASFTAAASGSPTPTLQWQISTNGGTSFGNLTDGGNISGSTTGTLTINTTTSTMSGDEFQLMATNLGGTAVSNATLLTVISTPTPPAIIMQPGNQTVTAGNVATFTVGASGQPGPTFQWQVLPNGGTNFVNLTDGGGVSGSTTATLTISGTTGAMTGNQYRAVATNSVSSATSTAGTLTVNTAPAITTQPGNQTVTAGNTATFTAAASGQPAPTFQWQVSTNGGTNFGNLTNGGGVSGSTTATLTISGTTGGQSSNQYRVVATNSVSSATSTAATLTVNTAPVITIQPGNQTVTAGNAATFTVGASGQPAPTFQWQVLTNGGANFGNLTDGGGVSGSATATLTINSTTGAMTGNQYRAVATNSVSSATSTAGTLTVNTAPAIITQPGNQTTVAGQTATFTAAANGLPPASFQWQISTDGGKTWGNLTDGNGISGSTSATLTISSTTILMLGNQYRVVATNSVNSTTSSAVTLTVEPQPVAPAITLQPVNEAVTAGDDASFTSAASGIPMPMLQWQISTDGMNWSNLTDDGNISGSTTGTLTVNGTTGELSGSQFRLVATNSVSSATSDTATLTVNTAPAITTQPGNQTVTAGGNATFTAGASGQPTPALQWQVSTDGMNWSNLTEGGNISGSTTEMLTVSNTTLEMSGEQYRLVATNLVDAATSDPAELTVDTLPSFTTQPPSNVTLIAGNETTFTVVTSGSPAPMLQWQVSTNGTFTNLSDNTTISGSATDSLTVNATTAGSFQYRAVAMNDAGNTTSTVTALTVNPNIVPPTITQPPVSVVVLSGASASFTVGAAGTPPLTYQWYFKGKAITSNATTATYTITKVAAANAGNYSVTVSGHGTPAASGNVTLTIGVAPKVTTSPANVTVTAGAEATFKTAASGTPTPNILWQISTNGGESWSNLTTTNTTLVLANTTGNQTGDQLRVVVSNAVGNATSKVATLTVNVPPGVPTFSSNLTSGNGTLAANASVTFSAADNTGTSLTYQWDLNGKKIAGATGANYTIKNAGSASSGNYTVTATNKLSSETSASFTLIVLVKPTIKTEPKAVTVAQGKTATFTVVATNFFGLGNLTYQWASPNGNLSNGGQYQGATNATLTVSGVTAANGGLYLVYVTNNAGTTPSGTAKLTVTVPKTTK